MTYLAHAVLIWKIKQQTFKEQKKQIPKAAYLVNSIRGISSASMGHIQK